MEERYEKKFIKFLLISKDGTTFTAISIIDSDSKAGIYKDVYPKLMTFLGNDAEDTSIAKY